MEYGQALFLARYSIVYLYSLIIGVFVSRFKQSRQQRLTLHEYNFQLDEHVSMYVSDTRHVRKALKCKP